MTEPLLRWVLEHSPATGRARFVHAVLALHADSQRYVGIPMSDVRRFTASSAESAQQAVAELVQLGVLELLPADEGRLLARLHARAPRARARSSSSLTKRSNNTQVESDTELDTRLVDEHQLLSNSNSGLFPLQVEEQLSVDTEQVCLRQRSRTSWAIADAVFTGRTPAPALARVAVAKIAERLLEVGWLADEVEQVMLAVPTITTRWCEAELNRRRSAPPPKPVEPAEPAMCRHCGNTGRISRGGALYDCDHHGGIR